MRTENGQPRPGEVLSKALAVIARHSAVCAALCGLLFALCLSAEAQQSGKVYRIGFLSGGFPGSNFGFTSMRRELRELGYIDGKNIAFEPRYAEDKPHRSRPLAEELVRLNVDVIVAGGTGDTVAAKNATTTIPI